MFSSGDGVIVLGDSTTHGGKVVSAQSNYLLEGKQMAVVGDMVTCPKDGHSTCSIIEGHPTISLNGKPVVPYGMWCDVDLGGEWYPWTRLINCSHYPKTLMATP